ncbi:hypothetical protein LINPERHAP2_LOCUS11875 [Linum perenne]
MDAPWAVVGDFNSIMSAVDKRGGAGFIRARNKSFNYTVDICGLFDLTFQGPKFTWARNNVLVRLDRALVNDHWLSHFPELIILHLHKLKSDHRLIILRSHNQVYSPNAKPFCFLSAWLIHASLKHVLYSKWRSGPNLPSVLNDFSKDLCLWSKFVFGNIFRRKSRLTEDLKKAEIRSANLPSATNLAEEKRIRSKLEIVLWQEDAFRVQKSRSKWLTDEELLTRSRILETDGNWITSQPDLLLLGMNYFKEFYTSRGDQLSVLRGFPAQFLPADRVSLGRAISSAETHQAIKSMGALKASQRIAEFWPLLINGMHWNIRDGHSTHFWMDRWVDSGIVLVDHALNIQGVDSSLLVSHVCSNLGVWNFDFLLSVLPYDIVMGMSPPATRLGNDSLVWGLEANGIFSIRSAYLMIRDNVDAPLDSLWHHI